MGGVRVAPPFLLGDSTCSTSNEPRCLRFAETLRGRYAAILAHTNSMRGLAFPGRTGGLSDEQQRVIDLVLEGKSVFVTGAAGTGKSFLLKKLREVWD